MAERSLLRYAGLAEVWAALSLTTAIVSAGIGSEEIKAAEMQVGVVSQEKMTWADKVLSDARYSVKEISGTDLGEAFGVLTRSAELRRERDALLKGNSTYNNATVVFGFSLLVALGTVLKTISKHQYEKS